MNLTDITTLQQLLEWIDENLQSPKSPPLNVNDLNLLFTKIIALMPAELEQSMKDLFLLKSGDVAEDITGVKTFINSPKIPDAAANQDPVSYKQFLKVKDALISHPNYLAPTASITSTQSANGLEVGQSINIPLTTVFNQNNGGAQTASSIKKDNLQIATASPYTDSGVIMTTVAKVYQAAISYAQGAILNNVLGEPDAVGRIAAGNVNTNALSYRGYYRIFLGPVAADPTTSAQARALAQSQLTSAGLVLTLNTGITELKQAIVVPPGFSLSSAIDLDASGAVVTYALVNNNFTVNDLAANAVAGYKLYVRTQGVVYGSNHRHQLTLIAS